MGFQECRAGVYPAYAHLGFVAFSGMINYGKAIKLLYRVEKPEVVQMLGGNTDKLECDLKFISRRKFKFVIFMQWNSKLNKEEHKNAEFLLRASQHVLKPVIRENAKKVTCSEMVSPLKA